MYLYLKEKLEKVNLGINWRYLASAPFIYAMFFPSLIFNICLEIYHLVCFRLYGIPLVNSKEYFIYDRQFLEMLNYWEKFNCIYCSYVNNLIRYAAEIAGRTERYWCPLKYHKKIKGSHSQYPKFIEEENCSDMREKWEDLKDFSDIQE